MVPAKGFLFGAGCENDSEAQATRPFSCWRCRGGERVTSRPRPQWGGIGIHTGGLPANFMPLATVSSATSNGFR